MRRWPLFLALAALVIMSLGAASPVYADAAPPQNPPGADLDTGQTNTMVQMVSENVLMTIDDYTPNADQQKSDVPPFMRGQVDATFNMQNQGDSAESFDVWFPIGVENGSSEISTVDHFRAWVDGVEAAHIGRSWTQGVYGDLVPWATWHATFPPGKPVTLRVTYDTYPTGYPPYGEFDYILETGAGWYGPIGEGTVTLRLPYPVSELNAAIRGGDPYWLPRGGPFTVTGTDVVWHFTNLQPTSDNNISLEVLNPAVWRKLQAAQKNAAANPGSLQAQLDLASAARDALYIKNVLEKVGGTQKLIEIAVDAYAAALKLDPKNIDIYVNDLNLLDESRDFFIEEPDPRFAPLLAQALKIAPDNQQLLDLQGRLIEHINSVTQYAPQAPADTAQAPTQKAIYANATGEANLTATLMEQSRLTAHLVPSPVETFTPDISPTPATAATSVPTPAPTPIPTATQVPAAPSGNVQDWSTFVLPAVIIVIIIAIWLRRRRGSSAKPDESNSR